MVALAAASVLVGVVIGVGVDVATGLILVAAGLPMAALATLRAAWIARGCVSNYGPFPRPSTHLPVANIAQAAVIDVRPAEWGGWDYRVSLKLMQRAAVVLRAGPGIRVDLVDGKVFAVTVDDAETGAERCALNR